MFGQWRRQSGQILNQQNPANSAAQQRHVARAFICL
jgi:hypothetical protein